MPRLILWFSCLLLGGGVGGGWGTALAAQQPYRIGPTPPWVRIHQANPAAPSQATAGWEYVLSDRQELVGPSAIDRYWHMAYRVLDERAVKENSQLEITFDSSYQQLILHSARVVRGGRAIDQLNPAQIHVAQRETQLEYQIFDGSLSVVVLLEDVRRGDVIEYSFTRRGSNPVFRGHFMSRFRVQDDVPIHQQYFRLLWQRDRPPHIRTHHTDLTPAITVRGSVREYEWSQERIPAFAVEQDLPEWFDPFPAVQVSDFAAWRDVAAWGDSLFPPGDLPAALRDLVARIAASSETPERRVVQALRFVQDEIRYMGVEIGVNSHLPYSPAVVTRRRYGDCKDKTLLLITLLRALDITARPALVSTAYRDHVGDFHPTAGVFDHAIVQVDLDGTEYWVDPSALYERGNLGDLAASYGVALVLGGRSDSLVPMRVPRGADPLTDIVVSFDIGAVGESTAMRVETRYVGSAANAMRSSIRGNSSDELQQTYSEYYAKLYPSIRSEEAPVIEDDEAGNVLRVTERYTIQDFWVGDSSTGYGARFEPLELYGAIPSATAAERRMPLAVNHPAHMRYTINAHIKEGWSIRPEHKRFATTAARFSYAAKAAGTVLTLSYEYETLADHVWPAAAPAHIKDMARARDLLVYSITAPGGTARSGAGHVNWSVLFAALFATAIACWAAVRVSRAQLALPGGLTASVPVTGNMWRDEPVGLGGWLILVGIGVTVSPFRILGTIWETLPSYGAATWSNLTTPGAASYNALWAPILMFELIGNISMLVLSGLLIWLYFRRMRQFPIVYIGVGILSWVFVASDLALAGFVSPAPPEPTNWIREFARLPMTLIWMLYMLRSRRVRNTFVR
jgi:transglutaminase-like putative cysteine protease